MAYNKYPDTTILVFCKAPIAGQVKTRLIPHVNAQQAADIHRQLSHRILSLLSDSQLCPIELWCAPDTQHLFFFDCSGKYGVPLHKQSGHDLGKKMNDAISTALEKSSRVLLVGCDCPSLTIADFDDAIKALEQHDVVLAPAEDGGYVMIGMKKTYPQLFENIIWGKSDVLAITRQRIKQLNLNSVDIAKQWDVDEIVDLKRYQDKHI